MTESFRHQQYFLGRRSRKSCCKVFFLSVTNLYQKILGAVALNREVPMFQLWQHFQIGIISFMIDKHSNEIYHAIGSTLLNITIYYSHLFLTNFQSKWTIFLRFLSLAEKLSRSGAKIQGCQNDQGNKYKVCHSVAVAKKFFITLTNVALAKQRRYLEQYYQSGKNSFKGTWHACYD